MIPIYEPNEKVLPFLKQFSSNDFFFFLVVDDGSGESYSSIFKDIEEQTSFHVLSYPKNKGKGAAMKEGLRELLKNIPDLQGIVTADGDGQHCYEDVMKAKKEMEENPTCLSLGMRDFSLMPKKSASGNKWSSLYFRIMTGVSLTDTQTGLRGIPSFLFDSFLSTYGTRYEFEMNFLMEVAKQIPLHTFPIKTIYEKNNEGSHFRPFRDSMRIMRTPFVYLFCGVSSELVDLGIFTLLSTFVFLSGSSTDIFLSTAIARVLSAVYNFLFLRLFVFHNKSNWGGNALRYLSLWGMSLILSSGLTNFFKTLPGHLTFIKFVVDGILGVIKFFINQALVFQNPTIRTKKD